MSDNVFWYVVWIEFSTTMTSSHTFLWPKQKNERKSLPPPAKNDVSTASKNNLLWLSCKKTPSCPGNFNRTWWGSSGIQKQNVRRAELNLCNLLYMFWGRMSHVSRKSLNLYCVNSGDTGTTWPRLSYDMLKNDSCNKPWRPGLRTTNHLDTSTVTAGAC